MDTHVLSMSQLPSAELPADVPSGWGESLEPFEQGPELHIGGAGPVGLYFAARLLQEIEARPDLPDLRVTAYDPSPSWRGTVIRVPFSCASRLDAGLRRRLWPLQQTYSRLFDTPVPSEAFRVGEIDYPYWTFIEVRDFQDQVTEFLSERYSDNTDNSVRDRFEFRVDAALRDGVPFGYSTDTEGRWDHLWCMRTGDVTTCGLIVSAGSQGRRLRAALRGVPNEPPITNDVVKGPTATDTNGLFLQYEDADPESYLRNPKHRAAALGAQGITYAHSNNSRGAVQIYIYPTPGSPFLGELECLFSCPLWRTELVKRCTQSSRRGDDEQCRLPSLEDTEPPHVFRNCGGERGRGGGDDCSISAALTHHLGRGGKGQNELGNFGGGTTLGKSSRSR